MLTIVKNVTVYSPELLEGLHDVLVAGSTFAAIGKDISVQGTELFHKIAS
jgi:dihydroorotase-like cyclic amidohydrolase